MSFLNSSKCHHNSIGSSSSIGHYYIFSSDENGDDIAHPITIVSNERDLGVTFDRDLKFTDHINIIVQKANNVPYKGNNPRKKMFANCYFFLIHEKTFANGENPLQIYIKTHGSVLCGPRKRVAHKRSEYIDRNNKVAHL